MKRIIILSLVIFSAYSANTQSLGGLGAVDAIFQMYANDPSGGQLDAERYLKGYTFPALNGLGFGVTGGWFNSAETHKPAGFDITTTVTLAIVPDTDLGFNMNNAITVEDAGEVPTIMGENVAPQFTLKNGGITFPALPGYGGKASEKIGFTAVPTPMLQAGIGLPKGTELKIRYLPPLNIDGLSLDILGFGVMHDIKQWIPGIKLAPFDLSIFLGYNKMDLISSFDTAIARNGEIAFGVNSFTYQAVISKKFSIVTFYGSLGASNTSLNIAINGEYDINNNTADGYELLDPIDFDVTAFGSKATFGFRLKLAVVTLHADYTFQKYNALSAGIGISVR